MLLLLGGLVVAQFTLLVLRSRSLREAGRRAEQRSLERGAYLNALIEVNPIALVALDPSGRIRIANPAFEKLFLFSRQELEGRRLDELIADPASMDEALQLTRQVLAGQAVRHSTRRRRKDGTSVEVEFQGFPLQLEGRLLGVFALYRDVSEQKRLEEEVRQAQKLEAVGRLAGGVAHDFNNLLTVILGRTAMLLAQVARDSRLRAPVEEIEHAARHASEMTQRLLTFGRKQPHAPERLDLNATVRGMETTLRRLVRADVDLELRLATQPCPTEADPAQLEQVLLNLVINAVDAMPGGGVVTLETDSLDLDDTSGPQWSLDGHLGPQVQLAVSDTGTGMDEATRTRVFDPFFTTKVPGEGTGLGLATVYAIVQQSGGSIRVDSAPGQGSTFRVFLPRAAEAEVPAPDGEPSRPSVSGLPVGSETVLVVEDEPGVRRLASDFLKLCGYTVIEAEDGEDGLEAVRRAPHDIDLVVSDVIMPRRNGPEMVEAIHSLAPGMKVLYMTGYDDGILKPGDAAAVRMVQKPFSLAELVGRVREVLDGGEGPP